MVTRSDFMVLPDGQRIRRDLVEGFSVSGAGVAYIVTHSPEWHSVALMPLRDFEALLFGEPAPAAADDYTAAAVRLAEADMAEVLGQPETSDEYGRARTAFVALYRERNR